MKDALTIALPTLMVLVGILLNRNDANRLDGRMNALEASVRGEFNAMRGDLNELRGELNVLRTQFHNDVLMLLGSAKEQDARIARLETRS